MRKIVLFLILIVNFSYAKIENVELLANSVHKNEHFIVAKGDVLVYSESYLITAQKAVYNELNGDLELFEDVNFINGISGAVKSKYIKLNLEDKTGFFSPFFHYEQDGNMWLECENAKSNEKYYITENAITSSCNIENPDWSFAFTSGKLNKKSRFLHLRNVTFYIRNTPVFYLPYFGIPTNNKRRTGLLIPTVGYGKTNGFLYMQPIFIAEQKWWDLEITPQIRTDAGVGIYNTFRFVDTPYSKGSLIFGAFKHKKDYSKKEKLKNTTHKGLELNYKNNKLLENFLSSNSIDDGLLIDITLLNDIDYLNLKGKNDDGHSSFVSSKINYFINSDKHYGGLYAKYYIDTAKVNNDDTLQELPTIQYHHYLDNLIMPNLLYSFDMQYHNYTRKEGLGASQLEANLPLTFYTTLFDKYLQLSISENLYMTNVSYSDNRESEFYAKNFHKISLHSDLAKPYSNFYHIMQFNLDYIVPSFRNGKIPEDFLKVNLNKRRIDAKFVQYFYNSNGEKKLRQSIKQGFNLEDDDYKYDNLKHEISYYFTPNNYISNSIFYSHKNKIFSKVQSEINLQNSRYKLKTIHTFRRSNKDKKDNFIRVSTEAKYNKKYKYFASLDYNLENKYTNKWSIGLNAKKKCWEYTISYTEKTTPKLTYKGSEFVRKRGVYIGFELYPLGGVEYDFSKNYEVSTE